MSTQPMLQLHTAMRQFGELYRCHDRIRSTGKTVTVEATGVDQHPDGSRQDARCAPQIQLGRSDTPGLLPLLLGIRLTY